VPAADLANTPHRLRYPYSTQAALAVWRALSFEPGSFVADPAQPAEWNRGAYLVQGLGHCIACHGSRNMLGATEDKLGLSGGLIPNENWYAPSLASPREAGLAGWHRSEIVSLLKNGTTARASVMGPMADVVFRSTRHLSDADLQAMAAFLQKLPEQTAAASPAEAPAPAASRRDVGVMERGARIYDQQCAYCHGDSGQGAAGAYPPLAGNRAVQMTTTVNLIQIVRRGGFLPSTAGNPRPYGMPPFNHVLDEDGIAAVLTYIRGSWGNDAAPVSRADVMRRP
jgi:mono/diheme cytochrome c family protein